MGRHAGLIQEQCIILDKSTSFFLRETSMYYENKENLLTIKVKNRSLILMKSKTAKLVLRELIKLEDFISDLEQPGKALRSYTDSLYMRE